MKKILLGLLILASACQYNDIARNPCDVKDPITDLPWLKAKVDEINASQFRKDRYITMSEYKGATVFIITGCCITCSYVIILNNCDGSEIREFDQSELKNTKVIWKPEDSSCVFGD